MYGVPEKLQALQDFEGMRFVAADDQGEIVYFRFARDGSGGEMEIGVEGEWVLRDASGDVAVKGTPNFTPGTFAKVFQAIVTTTATHPPKSIVLHLDSGHALEIFDSSEEFESFSIPHGGVYI